MPLLAAVKLLRPHQWVKNGFVFAGFLFAGHWTLSGFNSAALGCAAFCMLSSAVYCMNDILDIEKDKVHPTKQFRPLACGDLSVPTAWLISGLCLLTALMLSIALGQRALIVSTLYLALNLAYSFNLKQRVLIDVFCLAFGFMLRVMMGTWVLEIPPSEWILLCTFSLSLFLGFSKRYAELDQLKDKPQTRKVLAQYSIEFLRLLLSVSLSASIILYALYTTSPRTVAQHQTAHLIYTLPIVIFGLLRYLYLVMRDKGGQDTMKDILRDPQLILTCAMYCAIVIALFL